MTTTDQRPGLDAGALLAQLARVEHERDQWRAAYLDASAAADLAHGRDLDYWADGYQAGFAAGEQIGGARALDEYHAARAAEIADAGPVRSTKTRTGCLTLAELDRLRYQPGGRLSWLIPRPSDLGTLYDDWASYDGGAGKAGSDGESRG